MKNRVVGQDIDYEEIVNETTITEALKQQKIQARAIKLKAKTNQRKKQIMVKLIAPILLILTLLIAWILKLTSS